MCEAIEGIRNDGFNQGISQGIDQGIEIGILKTLVGFVKDGIITLADAAKRANMSMEEFEKKISALSE